MLTGDRHVRRIGGLRSALGDPEIGDTVDVTGVGVTRGNISEPRRRHVTARIKRSLIVRRRIISSNSRHCDQHTGQHGQGCSTATCRRERLKKANIKAFFLSKIDCNCSRMGDSTSQTTASACSLDNYKDATPPPVLLRP